MRRWILLLLCIAALVLVTRETMRLPNGSLMLHVLDVGQGSAALLATPSGRTILIDTGPDQTVLRRLGEFLPLHQRTIDLLVLSHPDLDHSGGMRDVLRRYHVSQVMLNGAVHTSAAYETALEELSHQNIPVMLPDPAKDIVIDDGVRLETIWPLRPAYEEELEGNNASVTLRIHCGKDTVLSPGDIEEEAEREILVTGRNLTSMILVSPHHGSKTSSSSGFLLAIHPEIALISAGRQNKFGHPHASTLDRYHNFGIPKRVTAEEGTISVRLCKRSLLGVLNEIFKPHWESIRRHTTLSTDLAEHLL